MYDTTTMVQAQADCSLHHGTLRDSKGLVGQPLLVVGAALLPVLRPVMGLAGLTAVAHCQAAPADAQAVAWGLGAAAAGRAGDMRLWPGRPAGVVNRGGLLASCVASIKHA